MKMPLLFVAAVFAYDAMGQRVLQRYDLRAYANATCMMVLLRCTTFSRRRPALEHICCNRRVEVGADAHLLHEQMTLPDDVQERQRAHSARWKYPGYDWDAFRRCERRIPQILHVGWLHCNCALHQQPEAQLPWSACGRQRLRARGRHGLAEAMPPQLLLHPRRFYTWVLGRRPRWMHNLNYVAKQVSGSQAATRDVQPHRFRLVH